MNNEGISSLAVVDSQFNVVGNISNVDVKVRETFSNVDHGPVQKLTFLLSSSSLNQVRPLFWITLAYILSRSSFRLEV